MGYHKDRIKNTQKVKKAISISRMTKDYKKYKSLRKVAEKYGTSKDTIRRSIDNIKSLIKES